MLYRRHFGGTTAYSEELAGTALRPCFVPISGSRKESYLREPLNADESGGNLMSKPLIVYYSRKGENYWNGSIRNLSKGNTEVVAEMIAGLTGGDLFEVDTVTPYAEDYYVCIDKAKAELREHARPKLKKYLDSLDGYDTIFVGYPNWWGTMPMAMFAFLEHCNLSGKRICPFCTNEGSGMGSSERDLKQLCTGTTVEKGLSIHGAEAAQSRSKVEAWVKKLM